MVEKYLGVGAGYKGLGRNELNKRMKQHIALRNKAIKKSSNAYDDAKKMDKLIGKFGSEADFPIKQAKQYQQRKTKTGNAQANLAKKYNVGAKKLYFNQGRP
jgi:hypothetical protein